MGIIEIGARIRQLREAREVKRSEFARYLGISEWQVERLESGEEPPTTKMLLRVAEALGVEPIRFFEEGWKAN